MAAALRSLQTGDRIRIDLNKRSADILIPDEELAERRRSLKLPEIISQTPWQDIYRQHVGQLATGAVFENTVQYRGVAERFGIPRDNH